MFRPSLAASESVLESDLSLRLIGSPVSSANTAKPSRAGGLATVANIFTDVSFTQGVDELMNISDCADQLASRPASDIPTSMSAVPGKDVSCLSNERLGTMPLGAVPFVNDIQSGFARHSTAQCTFVSPGFCKLTLTMYGSADNGTLSCWGDRTYT